MRGIVLFSVAPETEQNLSQGGGQPIHKIFTTKITFSREIWQTMKILGYTYGVMFMQLCISAYNNWVVFVQLRDNYYFTLATKRNVPYTYNAEMNAFKGKTNEHFVSYKSNTFVH